MTTNIINMDLCNTRSHYHSLPNLSACLPFHQSSCPSPSASPGVLRYNVQYTYVNTTLSKMKQHCNAMYLHRIHVKRRHQVTCTRLNCCIVSIFRAANESSDATSHAGLPTVVDSYAPHSKKHWRNIRMKSSNKEIAQHKTKPVWHFSSMLLTETRPIYM